MSNKSDSSPNLISASQIKPASLELEAVRQKLAEAKGPKFWRTLEELCGPEGVWRAAGARISAPGLGVG